MPSKTKPVTIIGAGSIGSFTALSLAKAGFKKLALWDSDIVGEENVGCQLYGEKHIGMSKVEALKELLLELTPIQEDNISLHKDFVDDKTSLPGFITVLAVDNMRTRRNVFENSFNIPLLIDGRIGGEVIRVFSIRDGSFMDRKYYEKTFYSDEEASELPCTASNVIYVGFMIASLITRIASKYIMSPNEDFLFSPEVILDANMLELIKMKV